MSAVDELLDGLPGPERTAVAAVVDLAERLAPSAARGVSYGVPALLVDGRPLLGLAVRGERISLYPFSPAALDTVREDLAGWSTSKGTVHCSAAHPLPTVLLERMLLARLAEIQG
ncbi:iron chaperone [Actinotalea sp.]|uniref:iron chaperone n=1 Tax=Actinotalea sp. TaxID=1872145 RepID=UPI003563B3B6